MKMEPHIESKFFICIKEYPDGPLLNTIIFSSDGLDCFDIYDSNYVIPLTQVVKWDKYYKQLDYYHPDVERAMEIRKNIYYKHSLQ